MFDCFSPWLLGGELCQAVLGDELGEAVLRLREGSDLSYLLIGLSVYIATLPH